MIRVKVRINETDFILNCNDDMSEAIELFLALVKCKEDFVSNVEIKRMKRGKLKSEK